MDLTLRHYGGQLKTVVEREAGEKIDCKRQLQSQKEKIENSKFLWSM